MKNKTTYIIDDDKLSIKLVSLLLSRNQFCKAIFPFHNPNLALDALRMNADSLEDLPDIILLDLNMPVLDGWQFLDEFVLLPLQKEIAVFIVTSSIDPFDIEKGKKYPIIKDYIMKPITSQKLEHICQLVGELIS